MPPDEAFVNDLLAEVSRARARFPAASNPTLAALTEEVGELAKALLHIREGKSTTWWDVYDEAIQVAAMALRVATEGDAILGVVPNEELCR